MPFEVALFLFSLVVVIFSVVLHELAHGFVAKSLGDPTAEQAGRLTLNPIPHLDPVGSILIPIICYFAGLPGFAWAKPVPYNPARLTRDLRHGPLKVALAGPATNLVLLVLFGLAARFMVPGGDAQLVAGLTFVAIVNAFLGILNLIPVPPFDGSKLISLFAPRLSHRLDMLGPGALIFAFAVVYLAAGIIAAVAYALVGAVASPAAIQMFLGVWS